MAPEESPLLPANPAIPTVLSPSVRDFLPQTLWVFLNSQSLGPPTPYSQEALSQELSHLESNPCPSLAQAWQSWPLWASHPVHSPPRQQQACLQPQQVGPCLAQNLVRSARKMSPEQVARGPRWPLLRPLHTGPLASCPSAFAYQCCLHWFYSSFKAHRTHQCLLWGQLWGLPFSAPLAYIWGW